MFWNFPAHTLAKEVNNDWVLMLTTSRSRQLPQQVRVNNTAAKATGLSQGTPILYRAGDQPNNALSLNVFNPGKWQLQQGPPALSMPLPINLGNEAKRLNHLHTLIIKVNRIGKLLCINGAGRQYSWMRDNLSVNS